MKTEAELRTKLAEILRIDGRLQLAGMTPGAMMFCKAAAAKTLLWSLGENDDDHYYITAEPGPPLEIIP